MRSNMLYRSWILFTLLPLVGCALDQGAEVSSSSAALQSGAQPPNATLHTEMARMLERSGETGGAAVHYQKALKLSPHALTAQLGYARLLVATGDAEQASGWFERAQQAHPQSAAVHNDLGLCYAECGRGNDAVVAIRRATQLQPDEVRYRNNLAKLLVAEGQNAQALTELLAVHPPAVAHYNAGYLLQSHDNRADAAEQFRLAVVLDPELVPAQRWNTALARRDQLDASTAQFPTRLPQAEIQ